jgi:hypothetical protein
MARTIRRSPGPAECGRHTRSRRARDPTGGVLSAVERASDGADEHPAADTEVVKIPRGTERHEEADHHGYVQEHPPTHV